MPIRKYGQGEIISSREGGPLISQSGHITRDHADQGLYATAGRYDDEEWEEPGSAEDEIEE